MDEKEPTRRLVAILAADVVGYTRLMEADERGTFERLKTHRLTLAEPAVTGHGGRIVKLMGDGALCEFASVADAVRCAVAIQRETAAREEGRPADERIRFRIGVHLGDVIVDGGDIYGDGVNIAARLQALAEPGGVTISGTAYEQVEGKVDCGFVPRGEQRLKNIAKPVWVYDVRPGGEPSARRARHKAPYVAAAAAGVLILAALVGGVLWHRTTAPDVVGRLAEAGAALAHKASIAILPFDDPAGDGSDTYLGQGLAEDITTALSKFSGLLVIAHDASFRRKSEVDDVARLGKDLGARYLVLGSIRKAGTRARVTAQLIEAQTGATLWSERYDRESGDVFSVQDEITRRIVSTLAVRIGQAEMERALAKPPGSLAAYDYLLRGRARQAVETRAANREARQQFERAIGEDPRYALAYAELGWTYYEDAVSGWTEFPDEALRKAEEAAWQALSLDPSTASANRLLGNVHLARKRYDHAVEELERAIELNPNDAQSYANLGAMLSWSSRPREAVEALEIARRLNPDIGLRSTFTMSLGIARYMLQQYAEAAEVLEGGVAAEANLTFKGFSYAVLAATYAHLDRPDAAAQARAAASRLLPFLKVEDFVRQFPSEADRKHLALGLREAGFQ